MFKVFKRFFKVFSDVADYSKKIVSLIKSPETDPLKSDGNDHN
jgi:hypothetical protein